MKMSVARQKHELPPVFDASSRILILGSFPSVKSRETGFYYGHPMNRFWRVLAALRGEDCPGSVEEKKAFLRRNGIALWDVIAECDISGSSDSSIRNVVPNDLSLILASAEIRQIFVNGRLAEKLFRKYQADMWPSGCVALPSTSPANASRRLADLTKEWSVINRWLD